MNFYYFIVMIFIVLIVDKDESPNFILSFEDYVIW